MKKIQPIIMLTALSFMLAFFAANSAVALDKKIRVVGSWSSLTMFKNFEKPFWT
ncbi:MAG: C4-dicarboxylate ABC transporter substrate-binding protein, partial [Desulfobacteraceae bacterium]|nr:C4-dicarboxylate ABC transporter substrate-binding protein [Desulfobacteraceae bacterium]